MGQEDPQMELCICIHVPGRKAQLSAQSAYCTKVQSLLVSMIPNVYILGPTTKNWLPIDKKVAFLNKVGQTLPVVRFQGNISRHNLNHKKN